MLTYLEETIRHIIYHYLPQIYYHNELSASPIYLGEAIKLKITEMPTLSFKGNFLAIFPELFLFFAIIVLLVYGLIFSTNKIFKNSFILKETIFLSVIILLITLLLYYNNPFLNFSIFADSLIIDRITKLSKIITLISVILCLLISINYLKAVQINAYEYAILILISTLGTLCLISSYDFLSLYLALETQTLCFYVLTTFNRFSAYSTEAGLKYFILGAISSGILLFGISFIYGITGTINFNNLYYLSEYYYYISVNFDNIFNENYSMLNKIEIALNSSIELKMLIIGVVFLISGLLFKLSAAPFHMWAPDVYEGAPTSITALFAIVPKLGIFLILIRLLLYSFFYLFIFFEFLLIICSSLSMLIGALGALKQFKLKRLFVYSSISHVGYMLIGIASGTFLGLQGLFLYLFIYMITNINVWSILLSLEFKEKEQHIKYINDLSGLGKTNPILALSLTISLFSMAGIPPLAGFYPKLLMFMSAFQGQIPLLPIIAVFSSLIGAFYYLRLIKIMYFENPTTQIVFKNINKFNSYIIAISLLFILMFFIIPEPLLLLSHKMAYLNIIG